ncbi:putative RNA-directed DNA polymerase [Tanacetum coccineum]
MKSEFVALVAAGKEAEWLKNLLLEIPLWVKPIAPISICYDSAATLAKAYSQMYNRKYRHLGVRHSMIRELITNEVISIEFVKSKKNLANHLTKGLARDLVIKSAERMGLKMCLEPADKEDEVANFLMVNFFGKVLSRSMNKDEPPMYSNGLKVAGELQLPSESNPSEEVSSASWLIRGCFSIEPSADDVVASIITWGRLKFIPFSEVCLEMIMLRLAPVPPPTSTKVIKDYLYQKKLHEPLAEAKPTGMKAEALSNMYEKPSASNKVFLIRQLVNTKMKEGAFVVDHVNEFNLILSRLMSVDIKFDDEVQALLLLSSLPESWFGTVTTISGSTESTKLKLRYSALTPPVSRIMDSGASFHATYCKEELERFKVRSDKVRLEDDKTLDIAGVGDVLDEEGYHIGFGDQQWKVTKGSLVVARRNKRGSLYMVKVPFDGINIAIDGRGNAALCHQRLGYMSEKGMKILAFKGRIQDLQNAVVGFCEPCVLGKQKKVSFVKSGNKRKPQRLELVHTYVYDLKSVTSIGGSRYYVTFINDNIMKNGIRMLKTVPKIPQQNGVAKRMNRTLNEREKSMRLHAGLPKMFWEDSVTTEAYLINRRPSVPLGFQIPKEEWQGKEVSLAHLRVFGCDSYIKVKDVARDKLDAKFVKCIFIGYGSDEMGCRFWDLRVTRSSEAEMSHLMRTLYMKPRLQHILSPGRSSYTSEGSKNSRSFEDSRRSDEEDSKDRASSKSPGRSSYTSEGSENSGSFKDSGRSDEEDSKDRASSKEGGSETPQLQRSTRESRALKKAINEELVSLEKNQTWSLVRLSAGKKALQSKWVFRVKEEQDGKKRYKARLVVKGFLQKQGMSNVKTNFLHGNLDKDIYMTQPEGFQSAGKEENPCVQIKEKLRHGRNQETQETVVLRKQEEGFRSRKADSRHEHHQR